MTVLIACLAFRVNASQESMGSGDRATSPVEQRLLRNNGIRRRNSICRRDSNFVVEPFRHIQTQKTGKQILEQVGKMKRDKCQ